MKNRRLLITALIHVGAMLLLAAACLIARGSMAATQLSQQQAERWAGESGQPFVQFTCLFTRDGRKSLENIYELRQKYREKFSEADLEGDTEKLFCDAWSTTGSVRVDAVHGYAQASVTAVGGSFFAFHPLPLRSGSYLRQEDLMKDRVMLDEMLAWILFGSSDVAGMEVEIGGLPYQIAGVVARETDKATGKFAEAGPMLYIPYETWLQMGDAGIDCYEAVLPEPVEGFAQTLLEENFPVGDGILQANTDRYTLGASLRMMRAFGTRGARLSPAVLPYWENAARYVEDWCTLLAFLALLLLIVPALCALAAFVWGWILLRKVLKKNLPRIVSAVGDGAYAVSSRLSRKNRKSS